MSLDTLWYTRCPAPTAASVAIRQGWLAEEFRIDGIAVRSLAEAADPAVQRAHYSHTQPDLFRFGGYVPPLIAQSRGADLKVIGLNWHDRASGIFALPASEIRTAEDLRGRRIGVPLRIQDNVDWWRATVLDAIDHLPTMDGLAPDDFEIVDIPISREYFEDARPGEELGQSLWGAKSQLAVQREEIAALYRGQVDAIYSDAALSAILQATTGARMVAPLPGYEDRSDRGFGHPIVLTVSAGLLRQRPDLVDRWVARLLGAQEWADGNRSAVRRIFANDTGLPEELLEYAYSPRLYGQLDISLTPGRIALLRRKYEMLLRRGFLAAPFDFDAMIDPGPLRRAAAAAEPDVQDA